MNYHVVIEGQAVGPYTPQQLAALGINGETLVWYQGLENWIPASQVPEVMAAINAANQNYNTELYQQPAVPQEPAQPAQPQQVYQQQVYQQPQQQPYQQPQQQVYQQQPYQQPYQQQSYAKTCPPNNLVMAIIGLVLFFPIGIPALIKAIRVNSLWEQGQHDEAIAQSISARKLGLLAIFIGAVVNTLYVIAMAA